MTSALLIAFVTVCYVGVAISEAFKGNYPMSIVFVGYSFANVGLIWGVWI